MRQSGACVASFFSPVGIVFDPYTHDNNQLSLWYLLTILSISQPLHPFTEHMCRRPLTEFMVSLDHPLNPSTPSPLHGAYVPATAGTHAGLLVYTPYITYIYILYIIYILIPPPLRTILPTVIHGFCADAQQWKKCWWLVLCAFLCRFFAVVYSLHY